MQVRLPSDADVFLRYGASERAGGCNKQNGVNGQPKPKRAIRYQAVLLRREFIVRHALLKEQRQCAARAGECAFSFAESTGPDAVAKTAFAVSEKGAVDLAPDSDGL
jgi:hypothetical protein